MNVSVRIERESDVESIRHVEEQAFGRPDEARVVDEIRGTSDWFDTGSIVAVDELRQVIGHVLLSRAQLVGEGGVQREIGVIGPIGVQPEMQRRGVGTALMRAAIAVAVARRLPVVCLVGDPVYYRRFGFEPARPLGIEAPQPWPDEVWQVLRLPAWRPDIRGAVNYPPAFGVG